MNKNETIDKKSHPKFQVGQTVIYKESPLKVVSLYRKTVMFQNLGWFYTLDFPELNPIPEDQLTLACPLWAAPKG